MPDSDVKAVLMAEQQCDDACGAADLNTLDQILGDDVTRIVPWGAMDGKDHWLSMIKQEVARSGRSLYLSFDREDVNVRLYGDVAVVTGTVRIRFMMKAAERSANNRYLRVWVRRSGRWQLVAHQATNIQE